MASNNKKLINGNPPSTQYIDRKWTTGGLVNNTPVATAAVVEGPYLSTDEVAMDLPIVETAPTTDLGGLLMIDSKDAGTPKTGLSDYVDMGMRGAQALTGLYSAYLAQKKLKMAKDQFAFEKAATNRGLVDQSKAYNDSAQNAFDVGTALAGSTLSADAKAAQQAQLNTRKLSESAIG